jgi:HAD superfamily hydrolase (TIGR01549 family)
LNQSINLLRLVQPLKVIAFDCDGVLFDSKEANVRFYSHILEVIGLPPVRPDQQESIHMLPVRDSLAYLIGNGTDFERAWKYTQGIDFHEFNSHLQCEPGLVEILELAGSLYRTALVTNRTVSTRDVLALYDLEKYFDFIVSASDVQFPKPHPELMERVFTVFDASPEEVLYIGDSRVDEGLALATGIYFVAYKNPELRAHLHIQHFDELHAILTLNSSMSIC